ncbi:RNA polymerase sigma factor SigM [Actinorhabdospora filicis]|uniref:RNA polymerase sigma factor SigM n=1 Tax=Actinorhabdospora filicis TaxID=1785913 RepID=A0A9W6SSQ0_9ACTN|nr:RNA polymerase sigma factor SigM [Actinorhabdospora filicis]GLZ81137.1 RNA polymerase sigma factor SigM [Actinorhabdospora filicis]
MEEPSDAELLRRHLIGDREAFGELFRRHRERLWAVSLRTLGHPEDAADALQEAMISAYRGAAKFRGDSAVTTWLHRIVVNACLDRVRRNKVRATVPLPEGGPEPVAPDGDPAHVATTLAVEQALSALPFDQRAALVLVDMMGYPVGETSSILGVPEGTVKSRCARGRTRLAEMLGHLRNPDADPAVPSTTPGVHGGREESGG